MRSEIRFFLLLVGLFVVLGLLLLSFFWNANGYFTGAYSTVIQSEQPADADTSKSTKPSAPSSQPRPAGFTEKEIEKQRGNGYATY